MASTHPSPVQLEQALADLTWLAEAPSLVSGALEGLPPQTSPLTLAERAPWREHLADPSAQRALLSALTAHLGAQPSPRLGFYAEALISALLSTLPHHQLISSNLVLARAEERGRRTLGALDLVLRTPLGVEHWELALKFYLYAPHEAGAEPSAWGAWLGPNARDTMGKKLTRLLTHQLPLSLTPEARERFQALELPLPNSRRLLCVGVLFEPWEGEVRYPQGAGEGLRREAERAPLWVRAHELERALERRASHKASFQRLPHPHWLSPPISEPTISRYALIEALSSTQRAQMFLELTPQGEPLRRWCVVPPLWARCAT